LKLPIEAPGAVTADTGVDIDESLEHDPVVNTILAVFNCCDMNEPALPCALPCSLRGEPFTALVYFIPLFNDPALFFEKSNFSDGFLVLNPVKLGG